MNINPNHEMHGVPVLRIRKLLRRMHNDPIDLVHASEVVKLPIRRTGALLASLVADGLVQMLRESRERVKYDTTIRGNALALASAAPMIHRRTATRILAACVERLRVFDNQGFVLQLAWAAAFGSILSDAPRLSDVDVAVMLDRRVLGEETWRAVAAARVRIAKESGRSFPNWIDEMQWPEHEPWMFLKARSGYLSLHDASRDALIPRLIDAGSYRVLAGDKSRIKADSERLLLHEAKFK